MRLQRIRLSEAERIAAAAFRAYAERQGLAELGLESLLSVGGRRDDQGWTFVVQLHGPGHVDSLADDASSLDRIKVIAEVRVADATGVGHVIDYGIAEALGELRHRPVG